MDFVDLGGHFKEETCVCVRLTVNGAVRRDGCLGDSEPTGFAPFTSLEPNWCRAPLLPSDWLEP